MAGWKHKEPEELPTSKRTEKPMIASTRWHWYEKHFLIHRLGRHGTAYAQRAVLHLSKT